MGSLMALSVLIPVILRLEVGSLVPSANAPSCVGAFAEGSWAPRAARNSLMVLRSPRRKQRDEDIDRQPHGIRYFEIQCSMRSHEFRKRQGTPAGLSPCRKQCGDDLRRQPHGILCLETEYHMRSHGPYKRRKLYDGSPQRHPQQTPRLEPECLLRVREMRFSQDPS